MKKRTITADLREACNRLRYSKAKTQGIVQQAKRLSGERRRALLAHLVGLA